MYPENKLLTPQEIQKELNQGFQLSIQENLKCEEYFEFDKDLDKSSLFKSYYLKRFQVEDVALKKFTWPTDYEAIRNRLLVWCTLKSKDYLS